MICEINAQASQQILPSVTSIKLPDGSMRSNPLHIMWPELPENILEDALPGLEYNEKKEL